MTDHIFSAVLTFALLVGGTVAFGSELLGSRGPVAPARAAAAEVTLPMVIVTGRRAAPMLLAADTFVVPIQRAQ